MNTVNNKVAIFLTFISILITVSITAGLTYAYLSVSRIEKDPNTLETACFNVSFNGENSINLGANSYYAFPMTWDTAQKLTPYTITITNNCDEELETSKISYNILLTNKNVKPTAGDLASVINYRFIPRNKTAEAIESYRSAPIFTLPSSVVKNEDYVQIDGKPEIRSLKEATLSKGESITYDLYLWIDDQADNKVMNYTFVGDILVYSSLGTIN